MDIKEALDIAESIRTKKYIMAEEVTGIEDALLTVAMAYGKLRDSAENRAIHKQKANKEDRSKKLIEEFEKIDKALAVAVALGDGRVTLDEDKIIINLDEMVVSGWAVQGIDPATLPKGVNVMQKMVVPKLLDLREKIGAAIRAAFPDGEVFVTSGKVYVMEPF